MARPMVLFLLMAAMILVSKAGVSQKGYSLTVSNNGVDYNEQVKVDIRKNSETFHLREASSGKDAGDIVYDFNKNLTMFRIPEKKSCFLSDSTGNVPTPSDLLQLLKLLSRHAAVKLSPPSGAKLNDVGKLNDRSGLSHEMRALCANLPIYRVAEEGISQSDTVDELNDAAQYASSDQAPEHHAKESRRGVCKLVCNVVCPVKCSGWVCRPVCRRVCDHVCG